MGVRLRVRVGVSVRVRIKVREEMIVTMRVGVRLSEG